ncbi:uncharacterized protein METZ01_LOCUS197286, partial [marine metagenome]
AGEQVIDIRGVRTVKGSIERKGRSDFPYGGNASRSFYRSSVAAVKIYNTYEADAKSVFKPAHH